MSTRLLLLTDESDIADLTEALQMKLGDCVIDCARTKAEFERAIAKDLAETRLLALCSSVIVPAAVLRELAVDAYNIHPGSPQYPGSYPACWAIYEGAKRFGATMHVMNARVDEGAIVDSVSFDVTPNIDSSGLARLAGTAALRLLLTWAPVLMSSARPLPANGQIWTGPKRRVAELARLSPDTAGIDEVERERRQKAIAQAVFGPAKLEKGISALAT